MHYELDFANAAAREFDVVVALGPPGAALGGMVANLAVQHAQGVKHAVVQVAAKHKGHHHRAQLQGQRPFGAACRGHHPAFKPGKALPLAALGLQIAFQRVQRHRRRPRIAVGPQRQVKPKHKTVLRGLAHQRINGAHPLAKILLVGNAAPALGRARRLAVLVVDVNQVNIAADVQFTRAQLAHADHAYRALVARGSARRAVRGFQVCAGLGCGGAQGELGQISHRAGDLGH